MKTIHRLRSSRCSSQRGQAFLVIIVFVCLFLLAMLGVATDYTQIWARRQMVQVAADAACQAGAADLYVNSVNTGAPGTGGLTSFAWIPSSAGTGAFTCNSNSGSPPCVYAARNGYSGSNVSVSFPASISGVNALPTNLATPVPYIQVTVTDSVPMQFTQLVTNNPTVNISAKASCGVAPVNEPIPLVILHQTATAALSVKDAKANIAVLGGPQRAIQVNSSSQTALNISSSADTVNLSLAGPNNNGADFAVFGGPSAQPTGIDTGKGKYLYPSIPIGDPFGSSPEPGGPSGVLGKARAVPFAINGCPDPLGCVEFTAGDYNSCSTSAKLNPGDNGCLVFPYSGGSAPKFASVANNWQPNHVYAVGDLIIPGTPTCLATANLNGLIFEVTSGGTSSGVCPVLFNQLYLGTTTDSKGVVYTNVGTATVSPSTAIFDSGLYYVGKNGLNPGSGSTLRMSTAAGDGNDGVTFYFSTGDSMQITASSGNSARCTSVTWDTVKFKFSGSPNGCVVGYQIDGTAPPLNVGSVNPGNSLALQCPKGSANPSQVANLKTVDGNILLGPCLGTYSSPDGNRGFVLYQARSTPANAATCKGGLSGGCAVLGGGAGFIFSGFIYFHNGNGTCGASASCLMFAGNTGSQSFTLGDIIVDELAISGASNINMILNPTATFQVLKPTLLQ